MSLLPLVTTFSKKVFPLIVISGVVFFYGWLILTASSPILPNAENPALFYSNQMRHDIKLIFLRALKEAKRSIFLSFYGLSDPQILALLSSRGKEDLDIQVEFDPSASANLKKNLPTSIQATPLKVKGLMHRKIAVFDHTQVFLGSANLTTTSLSHHANLVLGLYCPPLAAFLEHPTSSSFAFQIKGLSAELYLLPDPNKLGIKRLIHQINQAQKRIRVAMFTLTHPELSNALIQAKKRGVQVSLCVDYYTAKGASKKALTAMEKEGIHIFLSQGQQLLHHKWALIDEETLIMGSANWTTAAFTKNCDFLLFLFFSDVDKINYLNKLWRITENESVPSIETNW